MTTTYQRDYIPPSITRKYEFVKSNKSTGQKIVESQCVEENKLDVSKETSKQPTVEWTGVAPMGRLIDPRIIPTKFSNEKTDAMIDEPKSYCFKEQPNRFLKILRTTYPDLYERLKEMPDDELNRRLDRNRMYTTYQVDFCNVNEYPEGIYKSLENKDETSALNAGKLVQRKEPCAEFRNMVMQNVNTKNTNEMPNTNDPCKKVYMPFKIPFVDSARFISSGNSSHWRSNIFVKKVNFTEYMDTINKIGCVIMKNNIHNHQKCTEKNCKHQLNHVCANLK